MFGWPELRCENRSVFEMNFEHDNVVGTLARIIGNVHRNNGKFSVGRKERVEELVVGTVKIGFRGIGGNHLKLTNDFGGPGHDDSSGGGLDVSGCGQLRGMFVILRISTERS